MKAAADTAAKEAAPAVNAAEAALAQKAQALIDNAKTLVAATKYEDALKTLADLSNMKLTDAQQKIVDALKEQISKAMASKGTDEAKKAIGGLLK